MEMLLMGLALSLLGVAVSAGLFAAATRTDGVGQGEPEVRPAESLTPAASNFFVPQPAASARIQVPIEALLLQIERHVSLEQAAAESFLQFPTSDSLHSRTMSPLVH